MTQRNSTSLSNLALGGKGLTRQEEMRLFLGCDKPPEGTDEYDFSKGTIRFEYKHSSLCLRNQHSKQPRSGPTKTWRFQNLRGANQKKAYDYLILEGDCEAAEGSKVFRIAFGDLNKNYPNLNSATVTLPMSGSGRRLRGVSAFVWRYEIKKGDLKAWCTQLPRNGPAEPVLGSEADGQKQMELPLAERVQAVQKKQRPPSE